MFSADRLSRDARPKFGRRPSISVAFAVAGVLSLGVSGGAVAQSGFLFEDGGTFGTGGSTPPPRTRTGGGGSGDGFLFDSDFGGGTDVPETPPRTSNDDDGFFADDDFAASGGAAGGGGGGSAATPPRPEGGGLFDDGFVADGPGGTTPDTAPAEGGFTPGGDDDFEDLNQPPETIVATPPERREERPPADLGGDTQPPDDPAYAFESQDFGVAPTDQLHQGAPHGPTPTTIPGGLVVDTAVLAQVVNGRQAILIDVLGGLTTIQGALDAAGMGGPGSYQDGLQQQATSFLAQTTQNNPDAAIVFFCSDPMCWLSYNAALRAINAGYRNVIWYRGGIAAWQMAGGQLVSR